MGTTKPTLRYPKALERGGQPDRVLPDCLQTAEEQSNLLAFLDVLREWDARALFDRAPVSAQAPSATWGRGEGAAR